MCRPRLVALCFSLIVDRARKVAGLKQPPCSGKFQLGQIKRGLGVTNLGHRINIEPLIFREAQLGLRLSNVRPSLLGLRLSLHYVRLCLLELRLGLLEPYPCVAIIEPNTGEEAVQVRRL